MSVASVGLGMPVSMPVEFHGTVRQQGTAAGQENNVPAKEVAPRETRPHIENATNDLQKIGNAFNKKLQFVVDHQSNEVIVKVIDKDSDKVIRELPPEELQRLHRNLTEAFGLLFDEMV